MLEHPEHPPGYATGFRDEDYPLHIRAVTSYPGREGEGKKRFFASPSRPGYEANPRGY